VTNQTPETSGKGRPTPKRSEARLARKQGGKVDAKTLRARQREERDRARRALMAGDERYFPARDRGPVRAWVRTFIDSRFSAGELFVPMAFAILMLSLIPIPQLQAAIFFGWLGMLLILIMDSVSLVVRLKVGLRKQFPDTETRGATMYGVLRALQMRRLRVPPAMVKVGGAPRVPKAPKEPKAPKRES
jgi:hypothetical protein